MRANDGSEEIVEFHDLERVLSLKIYFNGKNDAMACTASLTRFGLSSNFCAMMIYERWIVFGLVEN